MSVFDSSLTSKTYIEIPKWDGSTKKYPTWFKQMSSFYSQTGCGSLLGSCPNAPKKLITATERDWLALRIELEKDDEKKAKLKAELQYCQLNDKAFGNLSHSIDTTSVKGKYVYDLVANFQDEDFPGGKFKEAWDKIRKIYERKDKLRVISYEDK